MQRQVSKSDANKLSVMLELQADYFAGVWAHHAEKKKHILEEGDIESGLNAASRIGDDALQKQSPGLRGSRFIHARHLGPARQVVPKGPGLRRHQRWRHVQLPRALSLERATGPRRLRAGSPASGRSSPSVTAPAPGVSAKRHDPE